MAPFPINGGIGTEGNRGAGFAALGAGARGIRTKKPASHGRFLEKIDWSVGYLPELTLRVEASKVVVTPTTVVIS